MTLPVPLTVRLANSRVDKHITAQVSDLNWRSVAPGGYASASLQLQRSIQFNDPLLAGFTKMYVYDGRSGETCWEGRIQLPGRESGDRGEAWSLTAYGPSAHVLDNTQPLIYIDWAMDGWLRDVLEAASIPANATAGPSTHPANDGLDALLVSLPSGVNLVTGSRSNVGYYGFVGSGMTIGAYGFLYSFGGGGSTNFALEAITGNSPTYGSIDHSVLLPGTGGGVSLFVVDDFAAGRDVVALRLRRTAGGATPGADNLWIAFYSVRVLGRRMNKAGTLVSGVTGMGSSSLYVRASWVVEDLLGRMLPQYDGVNAAVDANDLIDIDQLAYRDAATAGQVLDDLMKIEPSKYYAAWESRHSVVDGTENDLYRFEWTPWNTSVRYEATTADGFASPEPSSELIDNVKVRWKDPRGRIKVNTYTQTVAELADNGISRGGFEDISDEVGSLSNANAVGAGILAEHNARMSAGTLTVARPIMDVIENRVVWPWHIKPGAIIRVRGVEASMATNPAAQQRDGVTVFRIAAVNVNNGIAQCELDMFTRSEARALADLQKKRRRKR